MDLGTTPLLAASTALARTPLGSPTTRRPRRPRRARRHDTTTRRLLPRGRLHGLRLIGTDLDLARGGAPRSVAAASTCSRRSAAAEPSWPGSTVLARAVLATRLDRP